ncbi:acetyl-CoA carboxylase biotin carboxyl carrier protein [Streptomyces catenulae]|uniref:Biotin carboxyl carrier protein of acetyl-CoA carboxylase n=1 Tax=Streptomyces catenulae TaxID=66875 RepID=A0ABV2YZT9_9ACTN|nr:acetyl-CoA carboxylase biotin carboxyl carrier protein subunit [Streptomyces catenulae]
MTTTTEGTEDALDRLRSHAVRLVREFPRPPKALRLRAGELVLEAEWDAAPESGAPADADPPAPEAHAERLCADTVGVFHRAPSPKAQPFVSEGDLVEPGQQIAVIEAMKLMIPVEADRPGRIAEILKRDGDPVEYGEPLFALAPAA